MLRCLDFYYLLPVNENLACIVGHEHEMKADLFTRRILFQAKNSTIMLFKNPSLYLHSM